MPFRIYILLLSLLVFCGTVSGQKKDKVVQKKSRVQQRSNSELLSEAQLLKEKSPAAAIKVLEQVIRQSRKKDRDSEGTAYALLGSIYENIDQKDLALQRYEMALNAINPKKGSAQVATIHQRMGQIYLNQKNDVAAQNSFNLCINFSSDEKLTIKCEEGLADVELLRGNFDAGLLQLDSIQNNFNMDSLSNARLEARRSQSYIRQNDYGRASESFYNSVQTLPKQQKISKEEYAPIDKAQQELLDYTQSSNAQKIELSKNNVALNVQTQQSSDLLVLENLKIAALYEKENNLPEAVKFIKRSKEVIDEKTAVDNIADVYKKSYEINRKNGMMDAALTDLENYINAKEQAIQKLQNDLKEQVEIVKNQQQIDLVQRDFDLEEKDKALLQSQLNTQQILIGLLSLLLFGSLVFFYFLSKNVKAKRKANQLLLIKSLRTQMNPHFIFNALNSVNNFIAKNDEKAANKFLSEFSQLMRKVLDYSQKDFIAFEEEMELNELYLKLEHFRFRDKFDYHFENKIKQNNCDLEVPPMLIQPFIENAVWHGLRYKENKGKLEVSTSQENGYLIVQIKDDGIGRKKSAELKTANQKKYKSTGLENITKRIALINETYNKKYEIEVTDVNTAATETGTLVKIKIPVEYQNPSNPPNLSNN